MRAASTRQQTRPPTSTCAPPPHTHTPHPHQTASFTEDSPAGSDYLAGVCEEWESAAQQVPRSVRVVVVRTGIVLAREGGALSRMIPSFEMFAGGPLGSGRQWLSWIHRDDLVELMVGLGGGFEGAGRPSCSLMLCRERSAVLSLDKLAHLK